jgi:replication initiation and membrane attachment protein DnaB
MTMEVFPPLTNFYTAIAEDPRIGTSHVSTYLALLQQWNVKGSVNPFQIERTTIMKIAKINARQTYNRCMKDLQAFGYLVYTPSVNASTPSSVYLKKL